jgi:carotenoid cleavage dioxygenase-like enzyme
MVDFSEMPAMRGFFAPQRFEADVLDCEVEGEIPSELSGAFVRVGSDWFYPPKHADDTPFNQDGYVSTFRIKNGRANYRGRWIRTPRFLAAQEAGRQLFGYYRNPYDNEPGYQWVDKPYLNTVMNTAVQAHGGKLFALKEDSKPYAIDPETLETFGPWDFHGRYNSQTFTAHPKVDPVTGEMLTYGFEATGLATDDLFYYVIDRNGHVTREVRLKVPYVSMVHDWAITDKHVLFPVFPYTTSLERLQAHEIHWKCDNIKPTFIGGMPRDGEARDIRWFKGPGRGIVHTFNAQTVGSKVILDAPIFDGNPFPFFPFVDGSRWDPMKGRALIRRLTFDLNSKDDGYTEEVLLPGQGVVDLVRIDERFMGRDNRYGFAPFRDQAKPFDEARSGASRVTNSYGMFDLKDRTMQSFFAGDTHSLQEPTFIPRSADAPEGDGWLIGVANNYAEYRSELIIADTRDLAGGAVARVILPFRSAAQVHGRWYGDDELGFS